MDLNDIYQQIILEHSKSKKINMKSRTLTLKNQDTIRVAEMK
ncbi:hypothetical protein HMPREF0379_1176 [[Eubacterium] yurii subsp. margaretiae ATCC 43715]|nr:hypothetical protein HMPREF0379_1176 [[Eubacterium] yurii subsp. margaretiae ATCC 43715]